jgi:hypothetical protein
VRRKEVGISCFRGPGGAMYVADVACRVVNGMEKNWGRSARPMS